MRKGILCLLMTVGMTAVSGQSNFVLGVKPGISIQSSYFGLNTGKFMPYVGLDLVGIGVTANGEYKDVEYYWYQLQLYKYSLSKQSNDYFIPRRERIKERKSVRFRNIIYTTFWTEIFLRNSFAKAKGVSVRIRRLFQMFCISQCQIEMDRNDQFLQRI